MRTKTAGQSRKASCGYLMHLMQRKLWSSDANDSRSARQRRDNRACLLPLVARRVRLALLSSGAPESLQKALTAILERGGLEGSVEGRESPLTASKRLPGRLVRTEEVAREAIQSAYRLSQRHRTKSIPQEVSGRVRERSEWRPRNLLRDARGR